MSWDGMLAPEGGIGCTKCGKQLNPNGDRPAELYAGTYTGLCYGCQNGEAFCAKVDPLDGAEHWDFPPHCPSWSRDREHYIGYKDCTECDGHGSNWISRSDPKGGSYRSYCESCFKRYYDHPVRKRIDQRKTRIHCAAKNAVVNLLLSSGRASKTKRKSRSDGVKKKDHLGKTIWLYCPESDVTEVLEKFREKKSRLIDKYCSMEH